jgi:mono/diheme cytochrome c family protein
MRILKILGIGIGALLLIAAAGVAGVYAWTGSQIAKKMPVPSHGFAAASGPDAVTRGEHVARALVKCPDCHGQDFGGAMVIDDPAIGRVVAPNLTPGKGGATAGYTDADYERAVRHGIARDGRRLLIMPSSEYQHLSDEDLATLVAYLKALPAVDREFAPSSVGPVARGLFAAGQFPLFEYDWITHTDQVVASVPADTTEAYGRYIGSVGCAGCHGQGYGGGRIPGTPPDWPAPANLTPTGIGHYSFADFDRVMRTGTRPDGSKLHALMPIGATSRMTPTEMVAVHKFLRTLPPKEFGTR